MELSADFSRILMCGVVRAVICVASLIPAGIRTRSNTSLRLLNADPVADTLVLFNAIAALAGLLKKTKPVGQIRNSI